MELADDAGAAAFRAEARAWLTAHVDPYRVDGGSSNPSIVFADVRDTGHVTRGRAWQRELHAGGWAGLGWPAESGGRDLPVAWRAVWADELATAGAPTPINLLGEAIVGPTLLVHGDPGQTARFLAPILTGEEIW